MRLPPPRIAAAPPALIATHSTIYLAAVSEIRCIQKQSEGRCKSVRFTRHRSSDPDSVTRSPADTVRRQCITPETYILFYGVCSYYSPGQMYSPCLCFGVELGKNK